MIASLGMYDRPETATANDALWQAIQAEIGQGPSHLDREADMWGVWKSPDLFLSQTCGLPYRAHLHDVVQLVGTPDYGVQGCAPGYYRSVIIARKSSDVDLSNLGQAVFAYNETGSQSGWAAFWDHVGAEAEIKDQQQSGGHALSAEMVANGQADIASIDWLTWQLVKRYDSFAADLEELALTRPTPGLPFITSMTQDSSALTGAVERAILSLDPAHKDTLFLRGFVQISREAYLQEPLPVR